MLQRGQMTDAAIAGCENEPIRLPGAIQPHGVLLAFAEPALTVVVASSNAQELFGRPLAGKQLFELVSADDGAAIVACLREDIADLNPLRVHVGSAAVDVVAHRSDGLLITEWEAEPGAAQAGDTWHSRLPRVLQRLSATETLVELADVLAAEVRSVTGFDRVMVYRFDPQWHGEVIAEARRDDLEPFLGLRFPATDIPAQARALYATQWLRLIPDASYRPVPLVPAVDENGQPLDLSGSFLRSVSPVHLEYLANMGVRASMSVSLIGPAGLWGLVACHHYSGPRRPSYRDRIAAEFLGRTASLLLAGKEDRDVRQAVLQVAQRQAALATALGRERRTPLTALTTGDSTLLDLIPASGAAIRLDGRLTLLGETPAAERVSALVHALVAEDVRHTDSLIRHVPDADDVVETLSGVLVVPIGSADGDFLAWFRPETLRDVQWGGDPYAPKVVDAGSGTRLSPRQSFRSWTETVRATATPWSPHEVAATEQLGAQITDIALRRATEDSRLAVTLQRTLLMSELPRLPGVALAARYSPSANDVVGGDWYDLFLLPSGKVSIVLGDVAGHGLSAAAITAQLRHSLRAQLLRDTGPAAALTALNELIALLLAGELATAIVAELDPATGIVTVANAGHPAVLLLTDGDHVMIDHGRGPALGLTPTAAYGEARLTLRGADRLVLYTDGLVERRREDVTADLEATALAAHAANADPDALLNAILRGLEPPDDDDVTMVAIGLDRRS